MLRRSKSTWPWIVVLTLTAGALTGQDAGQDVVQGVQPPDPAADSPCSASAKKIITTYDGLPENMRTVRGQSLADLHRTVDELLEDGEKYLRECPAAKERPKVIYALAKVLSLNMQRYLVKTDKDYRERFKERAGVEYLNQKRTEYFDTVHKYLDEALADDMAGDLRVDLLKVKGYCYFLDGKPDPAAKVYRRVLAEFPKDREADKSLCGLIQSLLRAATQVAAELGEPDYHSVVEACDMFLSRHATSDLYPHVVNYRGKGLKEMGDAARALEHWEKFEKVLEKGRANPAYSSSARKDYDQLLDQVGFNKAFLSFALGDVERACQLMQDAIAYLNKRFEEGTLSQVGTVFKSRAERVGKTLCNSIGKPAPSLDMQEAWVRDEPFEVMHEKGNVVVLFFSPYGNKRSQPYARFLEQFYRENWHDGFRVAMIGYLKGRRDIGGQVAGAEQWAKDLGITYPVGLDCSENRSVYRRYNAMVGSGGVAVVDRAGNLAWYKIDPTERDLALSVGVFRRLLATAP